jgi:hypothetical protein
MEIERWRYVTIKECRAALKQIAPSVWDQRGKLKKGFKAALDALVGDLMLNLGEIASPDKNDVLKIAKKAAILWLEFGMQRCRVLVALEGSNLDSIQDKIQQAQEHSWELVIVPKLKRVGNAKGLELHPELAVGICEGEKISVSAGR